MRERGLLFHSLLLPMLVENQEHGGSGGEGLTWGPTGYEMYAQKSPDALGSENKGISRCWLWSKLSLEPKAEGRSQGITQHYAKKEHALFTAPSSHSQQGKR